MKFEKKHIRLGFGILFAVAAVWMVSDMMDYSSLIGHMAAPYIIGLGIAIPAMAILAKVMIFRRENVDVPVVDRLEEMRLSASVFDSNNAYDSPDWQEHAVTFDDEPTPDDTQDIPIEAAIPVMYTTGQQPAIGIDLDEEDPTEPPFALPASVVDAFEHDRTNEIQDIAEIEPLETLEDIELDADESSDVIVVIKDDDLDGTEETELDKTPVDDLDNNDKSQHVPDLDSTQESPLGSDDDELGSDVFDAIDSLFD